MSIKDIITQPITTELEEFNAMFEASLKSCNETLHNVFARLLDSKGKMMRPILLMLIAKGLGNINRKSYHAAISLELLHTASLIHDDIVDDSMERRGKPSINALFGSKVSVLSGDYILSIALTNAAMTDSTEIVKAVAKLGNALSEGEILQMYNTYSKEFSEEKYIEIITKKTASLFMTCTKCAAISSGANEETIEKCEEFGRLLGIAFQIKDDIFDYFNDNIGKPTGNDMRECKLTLPALYVLNKFNDSRMVEIAHNIKEGNTNDDEIKEMVEYTIKNGGIKYAEEVMDNYIEKAINMLEMFENQEIREVLKTYSQYIISRNH